MSTNNILHCKVAGVTFEGRQQVLEMMHGNEVCRLRPEPDNKYDPNAIAVDVAFPPEQGGEVMQVGYVPKELAAKIAPVLDGENLMINIDEITGGFEMSNGEIANYGLMLLIELPENGN